MKVGFVLAIVIACALCQDPVPVYNQEKLDIALESKPNLLVLFTRFSTGMEHAHDHQILSHK
jgi:hypothetical protein